MNLDSLYKESKDAYQQYLDEQDRLQKMAEEKGREKSEQEHRIIRDVLSEHIGDLVEFVDLTGYSLASFNYVGRNYNDYGMHIKINLPGAAPIRMNLYDIGPYNNPEIVVTHVDGSRNIELQDDWPAFEVAQRARLENDMPSPYLVWEFYGTSQQFTDLKLAIGCALSLGN